MPFVQAISGCDKTSPMFGMDQPLFKILNEIPLREHAMMFMKPTRTNLSPTPERLFKVIFEDVAVNLTVIVGNMVYIVQLDVETVKVSVAQIQT